MRGAAGPRKAGFLHPDRDARARLYRHELRDPPIRQHVRQRRFIIIINELRGSSPHGLVPNAEAHRHTTDDQRVPRLPAAAAGTQRLSLGVGGDAARGAQRAGLRGRVLHVEGLERVVGRGSARGRGSPHRARDALPRRALPEPDRVPARLRRGGRQRRRRPAHPDFPCQDRRGLGNRHPEPRRGE